MRNTDQHTWKLEELRGALVLPLTLQLILIIVASMVLDGGETARIIMTAAVGHWVTVMFLSTRRRNALTKWDTILYRWSFLIYLPLVFGVKYLLFFIAE